MSRWGSPSAAADCGRVAGVEGAIRGVDGRGAAAAAAASIRDSRSDRSVVALDDARWTSVTAQDIECCMAVDRVLGGSEVPRFSS